MPQRWDAQGNPIADTGAAQPTQRWDATGKPITAPATQAPPAAAPAQSDSLLKAGIDAFMRAWGADPAAVRAKPSLLGAAGEFGKEAATSVGKGIASEWKQPTVGGFGGKSTPLPRSQATAARVVFPFHLIARGAEGIAGSLENATSDIASGTPQGIASGIGTALGAKSQVQAPSAIFDATAKPLLSSAGKVLERQIAINKGRVGLVNDLKRAGTLLENQVTGENGEVGRHAQAVIAADKADLARTQSEGKVGTTDAVLKAQQVLDKTKLGGVAGGYPANMPLDAAKALITQLGREASRLERAGKAPEAASVWAEYDGLRKATQERADSLGPQFGKSWKHYISEFSNYIQLKKGVFGDIMEDPDHVKVLNKLTKGDVSAQIPEIKEWMRKYGVSSEPLDYAIKQGAKLDELTQQGKNMFFGKIRAIARHPLAAGSAAAGAAVAGRATGIPGMGFVLPLLVAGKVAGIIDAADAVKLLKEINKKVGPEMGRVTPSPEGPQPLPQPPTFGGAAPAVPGFSGGTNPQGNEAMTAGKQAPEASQAALISDLQKAAAEGTPEEQAMAKQRLAEMGVEEAAPKFVSSRSELAGKLKRARKTRASGVYKGKR